MEKYKFVIFKEIFPHRKFSGEIDYYIFKYANKKTLEEEPIFETLYVSTQNSKVLTKLLGFKEGDEVVLEIKPRISNVITL